MSRRLLLAAAGGRGSFTVPTDLGAGSRADVDIGSGYKSFPGMAYRAGRLHLVYRDGSGHATSDGVVKYRYSDDVGVTWSSATTIASAAHDLRDPSIVCTSTGRLVVGYDDTPNGVVYAQPRVIYSDDGGSTWSSPYTVVSSGMAYECAGTAPIIELADHTLLLPVFGKNASGDARYFAALFKSTDDGATWGSQTTIATSGSLSFVEPYLRVIGTDVVCFTYDPFAATVYRVISSDGGSTWGTPLSVISANGRTDWLPFATTGFAMWLRDPVTGSGNAARWTVSNDSGATWEALRTVDSSGDLYMYGAPVRVGSVIVHVYSLENSGSDADLYCRTYTPA
jgi:hypothetical protein